MDYIDFFLCQHLQKINISIPLKLFSMRLCKNVHHEHVYDFNVSYYTYYIYCIYYIYYACYTCSLYDVYNKYYTYHIDNTHYTYYIDNTYYTYDTY